ncbi:hydroxymethylbilane synthase [Listeria ivanovii]|uniref:Porphobilinogen deaminase n=2 Tax=Listeria ivanovii TaxID=1638 RepID=A0ABS1G4Y3_LISIV|nr:hydroxymethylbilane synthase [Listeria ivanovii]EFR96807.1 porphobilinogen deaminase [Listeria ivanovii FSL F6-596]AIS59962.1 porphobilinogen deaminase [Listeria ivanovii subsp. londoniensis]MBK1961923.1 hydroxymethylbilane synthase [Listeria ivanovii subsp. londoniensis]PZG34713.1 hydroxymethylbilane synthase [Listeria ivanovii]PZG50007.1 hydroxymethylbilane synthase [Listeria ivanovii]
MKRKIIVGSRRSKLALTQSGWVIARLKENYPSIDFEIKEIVTKGDRILDVTLSKVGGKGLFVSEVEQALSDGLIDFAVHSMKDVPSSLKEGLTIGAIPKRESALDCFVFNTVATFKDLPKGAVIGTSSLRRAAQILRKRPDFVIKPIRGNIDTRLQKLHAENFDAIILAKAGLARMGWLENTTLKLEDIPPELCLPAVGQGALAIECRESDQQICDMLASIHHEETGACVEAERIFLKKLNGGCEIPIAGFATKTDGTVHFKGLVGNSDGTTILSAEQSGKNPETIGNQVAESLLSEGAASIIKELRNS